MNIVEAVRKIKPNQVIYSKSINTRLILDADILILIYIGHEERKGKGIFFSKEEWMADDWEIEIIHVDFWVAWKARSEKGKRIRSEHWHKEVDFDLDYGFTERKLSEAEINGQWVIID